MSRVATPLPRRTAGLCLALLLAGGVLAAGATRVRAGERTPVVIELYTSQGCASCQPASRVLAEFAREPGIIALTFPITYWDYLGWKDVYAQPAFTARQRAYASLRGERQVFTPQAIVNGEPSMIRSDRNSLERALRRARAGSPVQVPVRSWEEGDRICIDVAASSVADAKAELWLLPVMRRRRIAIGGGENKGQVFDYINVVRGMHRIGPWTGHASHFEVPRHAAQVADADSYVVVLQGGSEGRPTRILGAAKGPGF
ncbi:hypothetical protein ASF49_17895 [Methylobacterium sp. Leaf104]|uniref:DUF1223 domain-containing protein n=1 Tax=Methylobacterium TaxID=407 RepID=UPI0006F60355|nr:MULTISPECIES: DUF1223 domain-containing protein [Methylobacterium]KQP41244.1 hypothetical protein ASF49_17895 [Methylobacterium sp. Leaf104]MCI9879366.1 DUF1223 domain-containing protein [Methylobacterium goesingense]